MKITLAIVALLGLAAVEETNAIYVYKTNGDVAFVQASDSSSSSSSSDSSSDDDKSLVQVRGEDEPVDHSNEYYRPHEHEMLGGGGYDRVVPAWFAADSDDIFMRSMIEQYALEQKTKEGAPSGKFWMDEASTRAAASEVLETNKGMTGEAKQKYLDTYFAKAWGHFDVNRTGKVEVIKMPQFMRFLASDQYMSLVRTAAQQTVREE